jgi:thioredoxin reductase (NADPH)
MKPQFDCIIIGGGIAGLQAAIQLGRYCHKIAVIDNDDGRSTICKSFHNLLGWPEGVSGKTLRELGRKHAEKYGVQFIQDFVTSVKKQEDIFYLKLQSSHPLQTKRILLATGIKDRIPDIPNIKPCLGVSIYVCPDCDGYEVLNKKVIVLGSGDVGAKMTLTLTYWTNQIQYINHDGSEIKEKYKNQLQEKSIPYIEQPIKEVLVKNESEFSGVILENGNMIMGDRGFIAFGGNIVQTELAKQLGVERLENKHILVNERTKETNVKNVWAAGDIVAHSEQVTIAMGEGSQAAIWIHKRILEDQGK